MSFLAIDLGATFLKGAVVDAETLRLRAVTRHPFPGFLPGLPANRREVDPAAILVAVRAMLVELAGAIATAPAGLLLCGQMHGSIWCDARGEAKSNFISWQDGRSLEAHPAGHGSYSEELRQRLSPDVLQALGNEYRPGLPITTAFWFRERGEAPGGCVLASLADFVAANLAGTPVRTGPTNAAAYGAYDVQTGDWHGDALAAAGLTEQQLPPVQAELSVAGEAKIAGQRVPTLVGFGDQQVALLGARLAATELSLNIATGSQVSRLAASPEPGDYQVRPFFDGGFLRTITHLPAGRALNTLVRLLDELPASQGTPLRDPWSQILHLVNSTPQTDLEIDLAFFPSAYGSEGALTRAREDNFSVGHLFRAAFRQMAQNYERSARCIAEDWAWERIVFSGGLAQKLAPLRNEILAQLGQAHRFAGEEEDTLLGLAFLARAWCRNVPVRFAAEEGAPA